MRDLKRLIDLGVCAVASPVALPLGAVIALVVRVTSGSPVLHRGRRIGLAGTNFEILKFRTMNLGMPGERITAGSDRRVTALGRWLRRTKLDELPQLINVARGDMALVGPRPEDPAFARLFPAEYDVILTVRPGLTGPAALAYRHEETLLKQAVQESGDDLETIYVRDVLPRKVAMDLEYVNNHRLSTDFAILASTVTAVLRRSTPDPKPLLTKAADGAR